MTVKGIGDILNKLQKAKQLANGEYQACCPAHEDKRQSLSLKQDGDKILINCFAGCQADVIMSKIGLSLSDLYIKVESPPAREPPPRIVKTYSYPDEDGKELYQVVRMEPKSFRQRHLNCGGEYTWNMEGVRRVLYHLPEVLSASSTVYLVEGEKDVDNLRAAGFIATTSPAGANNWRPEYAEYLQDKNVVVIPDKDHAGYKYAHAAIESLKDKATSLAVILLPGDTVKDVSDWLEQGGDPQLLATMEQDPQCLKPFVEKDAEISNNDHAQENSKIITNNRQLVDITNEVLDNVYRVNQPPILFERGGRIVRVIIDENDLRIADELSEPALRGILTRIEGIEFIRIVEKRGAFSEIAVPPPIDVVRDILSLQTYKLPPLAGIIETPIVRFDGSLLTKCGYDTKSHLYYSPDPALIVPDVPENPSPEQLHDAVNLVTEPLIDFPFDSDASYANAIATLITPQIRPLIDGCTPLALFDKPQAGTGATLLTEVISVIATGRTAPIMTALDTDEAWRKHITSLLVRGQTIAVIDNIEGTLYTPTLAAVLTSRTWEDRILGSLRMIVLPNNVTWLATGNNVRLSGDLPRRCIWIRQDAKMAQPFLAREKPFKHPHLIEWVQQNRGAILSAILTVVRAWVIAGKPEFDEIVLGNYERWCHVTGGILSVMSVKGFLKNTQDMYKQADVDTPQWSRFLEALQDKFSDVPFKAAQVADAITSDADFKAVLPDSISLKRDKDPNRVIGQAFRNKKENRYPNGLMIHDTGKLEKRAVLYQIINWQKQQLTLLTKTHNSPTFSLKSELGELHKTPAQGKVLDTLIPIGENNSHNSPPESKTGELLKKEGEREVGQQLTGDQASAGAKSPKKLEKLGDKCPVCSQEDTEAMWVDDSPEGFYYYCSYCYKDAEEVVTFTPTTEWQDIPDVAVCPAGNFDFRMPLDGGKKQCRIHPQGGK